MSPTWAECGRTCGCEEACPAAETKAECRKHERQEEAGDWLAHRAVDEYERWLEGR